MDLLSPKVNKIKLDKTQFQKAVFPTAFLQTNPCIKIKLFHKIKSKPILGYNPMHGFPLLFVLGLTEYVCVHISTVFVFHMKLLSMTRSTLRMSIKACRATSELHLFHCGSLYCFLSVPSCMQVYLPFYVRLYKAVSGHPTINPQTHRGHRVLHHLGGPKLSKSRVYVCFVTIMLQSHRSSVYKSTTQVSLKLAVQHKNSTPMM